VWGRWNQKEMIDWITISTPLSGCLQISSLGHEFPPSLWCCAKAWRNTDVLIIDAIQGLYQRG
jgi:hypothetical protein